DEPETPRAPSPRAPPVTRTGPPERSNTPLPHGAREQLSRLVDRRHPPAERFHGRAGLRDQLRVRRREDTAAHVDPVLEADPDPARTAQDRQPQHPPLVTSD